MSTLALAETPLSTPAFQGLLTLDQEVFDALPIGVYVCAADGIILRYNRVAAELWGREPALRDPAERFSGAWRVYSLEGEALGPESMPMALAVMQGVSSRGAEAVIERPDGRRWVCSVTTEPLRNADGQVVGAINCFTDVTERKAAETRQKLLIDELNHRVKNMLATVQSLAQQTLKRARSPAQFNASFEARLLALSDAHDLLTRGFWEGADLGELAHQALVPYSVAHRLTFEGPATRLSPRQALSLAMVFHELAANAVQFGALAPGEGRLSIAWRTRDAQLTIDWRERGGPPVVEPEHEGFGALLVRRSLEQELRGSAELDFRPEGLSCRLVLPLVA